MLLLELPSHLNRSHNLRVNAEDISLEAVYHGQFPGTQLLRHAVHRLQDLQQPVTEALTPCCAANLKEFSTEFMRR